MDSFSVFFRTRRSDDEIGAAIIATGASVFSRAPGELSVSRQVAHVWVDSYVPADIPSREGWPIPKHDVGNLVSITVSRDEESDSLAVEIAHQLVVELGGVISWDGHEYWRGLYQKSYQHDPSG